MGIHFLKIIIGNDIIIGYAPVETRLVVPGDSNIKMSELMQETVKNLLSNKLVNISVIAPKISEFFTWEMGRRQFTLVLRRSMKQVKKNFPPKFLYTFSYLRLHYLNLHLMVLLFF